MGSRRWQGFVVASLLGGWLEACSARATDPSGKLMVVVTTDLNVPQDLDTVRVDVVLFRDELFSGQYSLGPRGLRMPLTIPVERTPAFPRGPVSIYVTGLLQGVPMVVRTAVASIPTSDIARLDMPLEYLCRNPTFVGPSSFPGGPATDRCGPDRTCKSAQCSNAIMEPAELPPYRPADVLGGGDGTGSGICFDVVPCFQGLPRRTPTWDTATNRCIVPVPSSYVRRRANVAIVPPGSGVGVCDADNQCYVPLSQEANGDRVMESAAGLVVPDGVCSAQVASVVVSLRCPLKTASMPLCGNASSVLQNPTRPDLGADPSDEGESLGSPQTPGPSESIQRTLNVSGTVTGLEHAGLKLGLNDLEVIEIPWKGEYATEAFRFETAIPLGSAYSVTVVAQPEGQHCTLLGGTGLLTEEAASDLRVTCTRTPNASDGGADDTPRRTDLTAVKVSAGGSHTCALFGDGSVRCWGAEDSSQLAGSSPTKPIGGLSGAKAIAAGGHHTCVIDKDDQVRCWGAGSQGQRRGSSPTVPISGLSGVVEVASGSNHSCALVLDGTVRCWGADTSGQSAGNDPTAPIPGLTGVRHIACGGDHSCALMGDQTVRCWGANDQGQSGTGGTMAPVLGFDGATAVAAGTVSTCILTEGGQTKCIGASRMTRPASLTSTTQLAAGGEDACVLNAQGKVACWGSSGPTTSSPGSPEVKGLTSAIHVSVGEGHACAVTRAGTVVCWGRNSNRQVLATDTPWIPGLEHIVRVSSGNDHVCAVAEGGEVYCWGGWGYGQTTGNTLAMTRVPVMETPVTPLEGLDVAAGGWHSCAVRSKGTVQCWGLQENGSLGPRGTAGDVPGITNARFIASGHDNNCVVTTTGNVTCWGEGFSQSPEGEFVTYPELSGVKEAAPSSSGFACALLEDGTVRCWGSNAAGVAGSSLTTPIPGLSGVVHLTVGDGHACVLLTDKTVRCWGMNHRGQCADGTTTQSISQLADVVAVSASAWAGSATCATLGDGTVRCWGSTNGFSGTVTTPVPGVSNAVDVATGQSCACARLADGHVKCWGQKWCDGEDSIPATEVPIQ